MSVRVFKFNDGSYQARVREYKSGGQVTIEHGHNFRPDDVKGLARLMRRSGVKLPDIETGLIDLERHEIGIAHYGINGTFMYTEKV
jgi:hypothetical protein